MIQREAYAALMRLAEQFPVVAVMGPRQSGKSTLAMAAFPEKKYISFDDKNYRELAKSNPGDYLKAFADGVVIDGAQKVPEIFDAIKLIVDSGTYTPGKYILTGSSQFRATYSHHLMLRIFVTEGRFYRLCSFAADR